MPVHVVIAAAFHHSSVWALVQGSQASEEVPIIYFVVLVLFPLYSEESLGTRHLNRWSLFQQVATDSGSTASNVL